MRSNKYLIQFKAMADGWNTRSGYTLRGSAPDDVECKTCWDTDLCAECLGEYPEVCPDNCKDGTCVYDHVNQEGDVGPSQVQIFGPPGGGG